MTPIFKSGQIVQQKGDKRLWMIPTAEYYKETKKGWDHIPRYAKMTPEEFAEVKLRDSTNACMECMVVFRKEDLHVEYVLLELDHIGIPTGKIDTHVCEEKLKLSKKVV